MLEARRLGRRFVPARPPCCAAPVKGKERAAEMGETMSKRLKFHLGGEAEMEERAFANPFPDYEAAASAVFAAGAAEETGCTRPPPTTDELGLPFHNDGKVSRRSALAGPWAAPGEGGMLAMVASTVPPRP